MITVQDHAPDGAFESTSVVWYNPQSSLSSNFTTNTDNLEILYNGTFDSVLFAFDDKVFNMTFDYSYADNETQSIQFRFYSLYPPPNWLPYSD